MALKVWRNCGSRNPEKLTNLQKNIVHVEVKVVYDVTSYTELNQNDPEAG